ncbi:MAG: succinyldiaminopimelate transaminase [Pseudomonadales bacterium]|nr:succinyldiaminopimelate transaminase [Pseudomonadales bacterium]
MNQNLEKLHQYPFERLNNLLADITPNPELDPIPLSLGEPKHAPPSFVLDYLSDKQALATHLATYPATRGVPELRSAITEWLAKRFQIRVDSESQVLPVNGTREALFSFAQAVLSSPSATAGDTTTRPLPKVLTPNPFYQIYEGAAILGGATPFYINNDPKRGYQQDFRQLQSEDWAATELVYICSPGNPTGQVMPETQMAELIELSLEHNFIIASDECYSEIYFDDEHPPTSLLGVSQSMGNLEYKNCVIFHSLSKRSNLPGLRSGFVAGDAEILSDYLLYRTYHGCAMSAHHQFASALAWRDEVHVQQNRDLYRQKFAIVEQILSQHFEVHTPQGGFYHWLDVGEDDAQFARALMQDQHVKVVPGQYLARDGGAGNPGAAHIRVAWVSELERCQEAAERLLEFAKTR